MNKFLDWLDSTKLTLWEGGLIVTTILTILFIPDMVKGWKYYKKNKREIQRKIQKYIRK